MDNNYLPFGQEVLTAAEGVNEWLPIGQGIPPRTLGAQRWNDRARPALTNADWDDFVQHPTACFLIRERTPSDIPLRTWEDEYPRRGARWLIIVFRCGHQLRVDESPGFLVLARAIADARDELVRCPALGADAVGDSSPCYFLRRAVGTPRCLADEPVAPVLSEFAYVDSPGDFSVGVYGVRIYKQFDARALNLVERYTLGLFQAMIDRQRGFDRKRLRGYTGPLVYPRRLLLLPRRRRV